jgi:D-arabinose 1-dehydrogenase-like Zn-dependent alcohol dehydrogenase
LARLFTRFKRGDDVFGISRGSFAEYAAAREDKLDHKPANLSFEQAAVVPISALTALQRLRDAGRVRSGQKMLIIGASGGVGTYAVQLAKAFGAEARATLPDISAPSRFVTCGVGALRCSTSRAGPVAACDAGAAAKRRALRARS